MAKMIYRRDNGEILGVHIFGLHAADLIHEASNAVAMGSSIAVRACSSLLLKYLLHHQNACIPNQLYPSS